MLIFRISRPNNVLSDVLTKTTKVFESAQELYFLEVYLLYTLDDEKISIWYNDQYHINMSEAKYGSMLLPPS